MINSVGTNRRDIYREWERLDKEVSGPPYILVGFIPGYGIFGWLHGRIIRLYQGTSSIPPTYEYATLDELEEIDSSILNGTFQIEARPLPNARYDLSTYIYHQATGRKLVESE